MASITRKASTDCYRGLQISRSWHRHRSISSSTSSVSILEVGPRDGLQNIPAHVPTDTKKEFIDRLAATGLRNIEVASFVSPKWVPQLADGSQVMQHAKSIANQHGLRIPVLAPNMKGFQNAVAAGSRDVEVFASATEAFSKANQNCTVDQALEAAEKVAAAATAANVAVRGVISCIFSDPYSGRTDPQEVLRVAKRFLEMGCYEVGLGDTLGTGTAMETSKLLEILLRELPPDKLAGHFHDTYGQAIGNVFAAYDMGIRSFDASVGGLGGCPYAPGAKGNLATEDLIYALENSGISTGVDLTRLAEVGHWITQHIGVPNNSRAGTAILAKSNPKHNTTCTSAGKSSGPRETTSSIKTHQDAADGLTVERAGPVVSISLNRPQRGNSMTVEMLKGLTRLFKELGRDKTVFHIVLAAKGKYFCTGMDFSGETDRTSAQGNYYGLVRDLFAAIEEAPKTTIAVIDGPAYGGGVGLAFACDVRIASRKARFTLSEVKLGLQPAVISRFMGREWGFSFFREAMLSGRAVSCEELHRIGAIHRLVDEDESLADVAQEYVHGLRDCAPQSAAMCKQLARLAWSDAGGVKQDTLIESAFSDMMRPGSEGERGIAQFQKKVKPVDWVKFWHEQA